MLPKQDANQGESKLVQLLYAIFKRDTSSARYSQAEKDLIEDLGSWMGMGDITDRLRPSAFATALIACDIPHSPLMGDIVAP
jgi:hypothetical protein